MKVALLELDGTHEECLYSHFLHLESSGHSVTIIYDVSMKHKMVPFGVSDQEISFSIKGLKGISLIKQLWKIRTYIIDNNFDKIIFNSSSGKLVSRFCLLPMPNKIKMYGVLHGINKLKGSFTQKKINRKIKNYFLLNDYVLDNLKKTSYPSDLRFETYYPIDFPDFPNPPDINKNDREFWIGIPGQVEYKRRDYEGLVNAVSKITCKKSIRFLLLGDDKHKESDGAALKKLIKDFNLDEFFYFSGYLQYPEYHAWIKKCDIIMPLIHPGNDGYKKYLKYQITGGFNLAFAYKKPLLMIDSFANYEDFKENAIFYSQNQLPIVLENIEKQTKELTHRIYKNSKWSFENRRKKYLAFIKK